MTLQAFPRRRHMAKRNSDSDDSEDQTVFEELSESDENRDDSIDIQLPKPRRNNGSSLLNIIIVLAALSSGIVYRTAMDYIPVSIGLVVGLLLVMGIAYFVHANQVAKMQQQHLLKERKTKKKQKKLEEQAKKLKQEQQRRKKEQEERQEEEKRKTEERKKKIIKEMKNTYSAISDPLLILKTAIQKEKQNLKDYIDVDSMAPQLDDQAKDVKDTHDSLKHLLQTNEDKIKNADEVGEELSAVTEYNKKVEEIKKAAASLEEKFTNIKSEYGATPKARLARAMKTGAVKLRDENGLEIYKLPAVLAHQNPANKLRRFEVGGEPSIKPMKHILVAGMTGAGKSLLINNIINYIYGVTYKDTFRFQLVVEEEELQERSTGSRSKAESMTSWVTSFCLHWQPGFLVDYGVTIIDTPGFGDTRGITYDELIIDQLRNFFDDDNVCLVPELSCIGLVIQASQARITEEQKYIYDQVLNIFGRDMTENIFLMFTFADAQPPPALEVVKKEDIPFNKDGTFKFNNSALYAPNNDVSSDYSWIFGYDSLKKFFMHLGVVVATNLNMTREVLKERDSLKTLLGNLQNNIDNGMNMLQTIENMINEILQLDGTMKANKDHTITSKRYPQTTKVVNHNITNCKSCMTTCHDPCYIPGDEKESCASMLNGKCAVCPGKCPWDMHSNGDRIYMYEEVEEEVRVEDMLERYNIALTDKDSKKKLLQKMLEEYRCYRQMVFDHIKLAGQAAKRLEQIALRQTFLTNVAYIERLIESEQRSSRPNKKLRLEQLYYFKKLAITLSQAISSPNKLTDCVSNYEKTVMQAIDSIEDNEEDYMKYFINEHDSPQSTKSQARGHKKEKNVPIKKSSKGVFGWFFG